MIVQFAYPRVEAIEVNKVIKNFIEANDTTKTDKTIDAEQAIEGEDLSSEQNQPEQATFEPFTPDNFTKVSPPTE